VRQKARPDPNASHVDPPDLRVLKSRTVFDATFLGNRLDFQDGI
jgi:hypothetical protein